MNGSDSFSVPSWEAIVFSLPKKVESIQFSKTDGFTIRTLEWGVWRDMSDQVADYYPLQGYMVRNFWSGALSIDVDYALLSSVEETLFQKSLPAGWNLIGVAYKDDDFDKVDSSDGLWESLPYSQIIDFTGANFNKNYYSGEAQVPGQVFDNHINIASKSEMTNKTLFEKFAYGVFVNVDAAISWTQHIDESQHNILNSNTGSEDFLEDLFWDLLNNDGNVNEVVEVYATDDISQTTDQENILGLAFYLAPPTNFDLFLNSIWIIIHDQSDDNIASGNEIKNIRIYRNTLSEENIIAQLNNWEFSIDSRGQLTILTSTETIIERVSNQTDQRLIITLSFEDTPSTIQNSPYNIELVNIDARNNQDRNSISTLSNIPLVSSREITITPTEKITRIEKQTIGTNQHTILAGNSADIAQIELEVENGTVHIWDVAFQVSGATGNLANSIQHATLLVDDLPVVTNSNMNITNDRIEFYDTLNDLVIPAGTSKLTLRIETHNIGFEQIGSIQQWLTIDSITLWHVTGHDSDLVVSENNIASATWFTDTSHTIDILPSLVLPIVSSAFDTDDNSASIYLLTDYGNNTSSDDNTQFSQVNSITFDITSLITTGTINIFDEDMQIIWTWSVLDNGVLTVAISPGDLINERQIFTIQTSAQAQYSLVSPQLTYTSNGIGNIQNISTHSLTLGSYISSN